MTNKQASYELASSLCLNPDWLLEQANERAINLSDKLLEFDRKRPEPDFNYLTFVHELMNELTN